MSFAVADGGLLRDGRPFTAVGVNYLPAHAGCHWRDWDPERIERDFAAIARRGLNAVRVFVMWRDFEPEAGAIDAAQLERLRTLVRTAGDHGLACVASLLTVWMNGMVLDPPWRAGRDLFTDPELVERERAFVARVAGTLADLDNVLAYDLGDEIMHAGGPAAAGLDRAAVARWQAELAGAIRAAHPGALVMQANEASALTVSHPFGPDNGAGLDLAAVHGYPGWAPVAIESWEAARATLLPGFLCALAGAFAPPLLDELGAYGVAPDSAARYVGAAAHSALGAGATGIFAWCWQDIAADGEPYASRPHERTAGLLDGDGRPKPALAAVEAVAAHAAAWRGLRAAPADVAIYVPELFRTTGGAYLGDPPAEGGALFAAYALARRAHLPVAFAREDLGRFRLVLAPSACRLTDGDLARLQAFVEAGGCLYLSPGDRLHGFGGRDLLGVELDGFTVDPGARATVAWGGAELALPAGADPHEPLPVVRSAGARVEATFPGGDPALTVAHRGRGRAWCLNAPLERRLDTPFALDRTPWTRLYRALAADAGAVPALTCESEEVELHVGVSPDGGRTACLAVNHATTAVRTRLRGPLGGGAPLHLAPKAAAIVELTATERRAA